MTALNPTASDTSTGVATKELLAELWSWLNGNWDPDITVAEWWERLGLAGYSVPTLPTNAYGRGVSRADAVAISNEIANFGAVGAPGGLGPMLAAPTIATHGTQEQIDRYVKAIVTGQEAWCQLFSEPGAGSDLAGLTSKAVREGEEWIVNGQKVWTSAGHLADLGMLIARTDPEAPKHAGITWMICNMRQPGVEVRPLREMTGNAMFNEVFLSDVRVPNSDVVSEPGDGWRVACSTLGFERASLGAGGGNSGSSQVVPGTVAGNLARRVGDFATAPKMRTTKPAADSVATDNAPPKPRSSATTLIAFAQRVGKNNDPLIRQRLVELHTIGEVGRLNTERMKASKDIPGMPNVAKLLMSNVVRLSRDLGLDIAGAQGMLHAYDEDQTRALRVAHAETDPALPGVTAQALYAQAPPIYGGTDQIQRNIIGERVLGLPKEPGSNSKTPFSDLPKNG